MRRKNLCKNHNSKNIFPRIFCDQNAQYSDAKTARKYQKSKKKVKRDGLTDAIGGQSGVYSSEARDLEYIESAKQKLKKPHIRFTFLAFLFHSWAIF